MQPRIDVQTKLTMTRRSFNRTALASALLAIAAVPRDGEAAAEEGASSKLRNVIKQRLPGDPPREITLVEVTYPPGTGSPPHLHANGVMAFVVAGAIASKVGDQPEQVFHEGEAWWEPLGAVHRVSRNASSVEPATLLAIYIAPPGVAFEDLYKPI
jgi:quercetin dioxygenase-like cupin family protein